MWVTYEGEFGSAWAEAVTNLCANHRNRGVTVALDSWQEPGNPSSLHSSRLGHPHCFLAQSGLYYQTYCISIKCLPTPTKVSSPCLNHLDLMQFRQRFCLVHLACCSIPPVQSDYKSKGSYEKVGQFDKAYVVGDSKTHALM